MTYYKLDNNELLHITENRNIKTESQKIATATPGEINDSAAFYEDK